jgi:hypothetical protein
MFKLKNFSVIILIFSFAVNPVIHAQIIKDDFRINDDVIGGDHRDPDVEILENGEAVIIWRDDRNGQRNVYGQAYDSDGDAVGSNFKVSTYDATQYETHPLIAPFGDTLLAVWEYHYGQFLLSDGSKEGTSFSLGNTNLNNLDIAVSDSGLFVVWRHNPGGGDYDILLKRFDFNGDSIGQSIILNDDGGSEDQNYPSIAMDDAGNFVVVWGDRRSGSSYDIYGQLVDASGDKIGGNILVNDDGGSYSQYDPACAMSSGGNFVVVWYDYRNGHADIYGQRFDNTGSAIGSNFLINDDGASYYQYTPSCAMDSAGNFVVVWYDSRLGDQKIYGQRYSSAGTSLGGNFRIDQSGSLENNYSPRVSMNEDYFVVVWEKENVDNTICIYKRRYYNNGTSVENEVKVNDLDGIANQTSPNMDMNSSGNVVVAWRDERYPRGVYFQRLDALGNTLGGNVHIGMGYSPDVAVSEDSNFFITYYNPNIIQYQKIRPSGDSVGSPIIVSDTTSGLRYNPRIDIDSDNNAVVTWYDSRAGNYDIYAQMVNAAGDTVGNNFRVNEAEAATQYAPDVAISPSGIILITWYDNRNGDYDIYGQIYASDGTPDGSNFRIDAGGTSAQYVPDAGALPDGNFMVAWQDYRYPAGVYAQVVDSTGVLIDTNFLVSNRNGYNPSVGVAASGDFVITWEDVYSSEYDIYAQKYNSDYSPDSINFKVNNASEGLNTQQRYPCVTTDGSSIIFAWQDAKWQRGWDIAGKVCDWSIGGIEDVSEEGVGLAVLNISSPILSGRGWLTFYVDSPAKIDFHIINVAGVVVSSKELDYTTPGVKRVDFDVSKLPCGPYFLTLESGEEVKVSKKAVVIR